MPCRPKSKAQARFLGAVAGGAAQPAGLSKDKAKDATRGVKHKDLPARAKAGGKKR
jgi:hypothetical protein